MSTPREISEEAHRNLLLATVGQLQVWSLHDSVTDGDGDGEIVVATAVGLKSRRVRVLTAGGDLCEVDAFNLFDVDDPSFNWM